MRLVLITGMSGSGKSVALRLLEDIGYYCGSTTFRRASSNPAPHVVAFVGDYKKRYGGEPNQFAAQAFDAVGILLEAIKRVGPNATRAQIRDSLAATANYPGVTGVTTFDKATREPNKTLAKLQIKDGKFVVVH